MSIKSVNEDYKLVHEKKEWIKTVIKNQEKGHKELVWENFVFKGNFGNFVKKEV